MHRTSCRGAAAGVATWIPGHPRGAPRVAHRRRSRVRRTRGERIARTTGRRCRARQPRPPPGHHRRTTVDRRGCARGAGRPRCADHHQVGTCTTGPDGMGVVEPRTLRVHGSTESAARHDGPHERPVDAGRGEDRPGRHRRTGILAVEPRGSPPEHPTSEAATGAARNVPGTSLADSPVQFLTGVIDGSQCHATVSALPAAAVARPSAPHGGGQGRACSRLSCPGRGATSSGGGSGGTRRRSRSRSRPPATRRRTTR